MTMACGRRWSYSSIGTDDDLSHVLNNEAVAVCEAWRQADGMTAEFGVGVIGWRHEHFLSYTAFFAV